MNEHDASILITGAARRLGRAIALRLAAPGRRLAIHYRNSRAEAEETAAECRARGADSGIFQADTSCAGEAVSLVERAAARFGLDVLINNASAYFATPVGEVTEEQFDELLDANTKGPFFASQAAARIMKESGRGGMILNLADAAWDRPTVRHIPYMMSKAALVCMTRGLARALAPGIRVNAIAPGAVLLPEGTPPEEVHRSIARTPLGRVGAAEDIAAAAEYLIFRAPYVTGIVLSVDGGRGVA